MKHTTQQLYGVPPSEFKDLILILERKKELAIKRLREVMSVHYTERDEALVFAINKAVEFNNRMIEEIKDEC